MSVGVDYESKRCLKVRTVAVGGNYASSKIAYINMNAVLYARQTNEVITDGPTPFNTYDLKFLNGPQLRVLGGVNFGINIHSFGVDNANEVEAQDTNPLDASPGLAGGGGTAIDFETKRCFWVIELDDNLNQTNPPVYVNANNITYTLLLPNTILGVGNYIEIHFLDGTILKVAEAKTGFNNSNYGEHSFSLYNRAVPFGFEEQDSNPEDSTP